jgi:hypothetical protein
MYANMFIAWGDAPIEEALYIKYNKRQGFYYLCISSTRWDCAVIHRLARPGVGTPPIFISHASSVTPRRSFTDMSASELPASKNQLFVSKMHLQDCAQREKLVLLEETAYFPLLIR